MAGVQPRGPEPVSALGSALGRPVWVTVYPEVKWKRGAQGLRAGPPTSLCSPLARLLSAGWVNAEPSRLTSSRRTQIEPPPGGEARTAVVSPFHAWPHPGQAASLPAHPVLMLSLLPAGPLNDSPAHAGPAPSPGAGPVIPGALPSACHPVAPRPWTLRLRGVFRVPSASGTRSSIVPELGEQFAGTETLPEGVTEPQQTQLWGQAALPPCPPWPLCGS